jgi:hypothetical protein
MRYAITLPIPDLFDAERVELARAVAVSMWRDATGSSGEPDEVNLHETAKIGGVYVDVGTDWETDCHRMWRVAGEVRLSDVDERLAGYVRDAVLKVAANAHMSRDVALETITRSGVIPATPYADALLARVSDLLEATP